MVSNCFCTLDETDIKSHNAQFQTFKSIQSKVMMISVIVTQNVFQISTSFEAKCDFQAF